MINLLRRYEETGEQKRKRRLQEVREGKNKEVSYTVTQSERSIVTMPDPQEGTSKKG